MPTETIYCQRMSATVPAWYCGKHAVHCKGCPLLQNGAKLKPDFREFFATPRKYFGVETIERRSTAYGSTFGWQE
ncbi:MAG: hypothetical protein PHN64_03910 [Desulfovibrionaceae bacterium]|nr:hypothetical protein [Desulfovibrionaceae bacterium]